MTASSRSMNRVQSGANSYRCANPPDSPPPASLSLHNSMLFLDVAFDQNLETPG